MEEDLHALTGAYALGALHDEDERLRFEGHLANCDPCTAELAGLAETAGRLGTAVAQAPPPGLRERTLAAITGERRAAPAVRMPPPRRRPYRLVAGLVAASLAVAVASGVVAIRAEQRADRIEAAGRAVTRVLAAPDAHAVTGEVTSGGTATVVVSRSQGKVVVASWALRTLPPSRTYEMWFMGPGGVRPAGLFRPDGSGRGQTVVSGLVEGTDRIGLTVEPATGSPRPTTPPVLVLRIS